MTTHLNLECIIYVFVEFYCFRGDDRGPRRRIGGFGGSKGGPSAPPMAGGG